MKLYEAKKIIKEVFENSFDKDQFTYFIRNLLKNLEIKPFGNGGAYTGNIIPRAFQGIIRKMERIGKFEDNEGNIIDILIVELNNKNSIEHARSSQRNFIRWYLDGSRGGELKDATLVAFYTQKSPEWRFSFIKMQYSLSKGKDILTPAKRSSFLVGEKGKSHTPQQQLINLLQNDNPPTLADLENAFNIETVSEEFYEKYKNLVFNLKDELDKIIKKNNAVRTEFEQKHINTLNFSKKLLGQIVFLYFLQRKGWLGLQEGQKYGEGNRKFMRELFNQAKNNGKNFFNDYLEYLFYDALSKKRTTDFYEKFNCRIPFLNGGLFDPINFYNWEEIDIIISNELFSNKTDEDNEGTGILDIFDLYNFTVKEDEPLEKEIAIDPEMLGKVFERMLEVKERKNKGAFYTPREIVHYMAQQSLIYYLLNSTLTEEKKTKSEKNNSPLQEGCLEEVGCYPTTEENKAKPNKNNSPLQEGCLEEAGCSSTTEENKAKPNKNNSPLQEGCLEEAGCSSTTEEKLKKWKKDLEIFIRFGEQIIDKDIAIETGKLKKSNNRYQIPESIRKNAKKIDKALENIKICDPAVGSGAFPVGIMNEIVKLRNILTPFIEPHLREKNTPSADADTPLIEGKKTKSDKNNSPLQEGCLEEAGCSSITETKRTSYFFKANVIQNSIYGVDIDAGAVEIAKLRLWLSLIVDESNINRIDPLPNLEYKIVQGNSLINMPENIMRDFKLENEIQELTKHYYTITDKAEKQRQKEIIDKKIKQLLKSASEWAGYKIDFDFKLYFHEVFNQKASPEQNQRNGFDIVIGNPPYISLSKYFDEKRKHADLYQNMNFRTFDRSADIYTLFYEKGIDILHNLGILTFISSNKWMRTKYGKHLRKFLSMHNPLKLIDLGPNIFANATVDTNILIIQKKDNTTKTQHKISLQAAKFNPEKHKNIANIKDNDFVTLTNLSEDSWIILTPEEQKIKQRIEQIGTPLKDWDINIYRGILTGYNEAFIIDGKTKDKLIAQDPKSAEIIKPILRGRDIKRYKANFADLWLINTHNGYKDENRNYVPPVDINHYPAIKKHLDKYLDKLKKRQDKGVTPYNLRNCAYYQEFEKEKIVWGNISYGSEFYLDKQNFYINAPANLLTSNNDDVKYIIANFNSKFFEYQFIKRGIDLGKAFEWKMQYIYLLYIPKIPKYKQKPFEILVDYILFLNTPSADADTPLIEENEAKPNKNNSPLKRGGPIYRDGVFIKYKKLPYNPKLKQKARELRKAGNLSEVLLWQKIKNKQLLGLDFHRQKIIGNYIVDFYCPQLDLVIEIDGYSHDLKGEHDLKKEKFLKNLNLNIVHFEDKRIKQELDNILFELENYCLELIKKNTPSANADTPLIEGNAAKSNKNNSPLTEGCLEEAGCYPLIEGKNTLSSLRSDTYLKEGNKEKSRYFEKIIDGMVYELYFEDEFKKAGCEIIKHLSNLPELTEKMSDYEKQKIINKIFITLYDKNHPVRKNLNKMNEIEEIKIIKDAK